MEIFFNLKIFGECCGFFYMHNYKSGFYQVSRNALMVL